MHGFQQTSPRQSPPGIASPRPDGTACSAELRLRASSETRKLYPFDFELLVRFELAGGCLAQQVQVVNHGAAAMPASFGFHPAFCWPVDPQERGAHYVQFTHAESSAVFRVGADGSTVPTVVPLDMRNTLLQLDDDLFTEGALVFNPLRSTGLTYLNQQGPLLELAWSGCRQLGLWSLPGAPFVCFEPWCGYPSPAGFDGSLLEKPGGFVLEPGQTQSFGLTIRPATLA